MFRLLSTLLVALALFFSPLAMMGDGGMAMAHGPSAAMAGTGGHCAGADTSSDEDKDAQAMLDCMSICSAIATGQQAALKHEPPVPALAEPVRLPFLRGLHPESETPPPRIS